MVGRSWWGYLGRLLFPASCLGCADLGGKYLCGSCLTMLQPGRCLIMGRSVVTLGRYEALLAEALTEVKRKGHKALAQELADVAALTVAELWEGSASWTVHGVRPSREGQRYRGFSLPQMMEKAIVCGTGSKSLAPQLLSHFPASRASSRGLSLEKRWERQTEPEAVRPAACQPRGPLLLVDDVVTTGATLSKAIVTAESLGFEPICCFALALAPELES